MTHHYSLAFQHTSQHVRDTLATRLAVGAHLFKTDVDPETLYSRYLDWMPKGLIEPGAGTGMTIRQFHNCNCCRRFIQKFGGLVVIDANGKTESALWASSRGSAGDIYGRSFKAMAALVGKANVTGVFSTDELTMGTPEAGGHHHLYVPTPTQSVKRDPTPWSAQKHEDMGTLARALTEYPVPLLTKALAILGSGTVFGAEKVIGNAKFLLECHAAAGNRNILWSLVAGAPNGWASPRTNMIGVFMDDLKDGTPATVAIAKFADKMDGLKYQRPTEAPKAGTVAQADKLFTQLGLAAALKRRFATLDDVEILWRARVTIPAKAPPARLRSPVFGNIPIKEHKPATPAPTVLAGVTAITFDKFRRVVLPTVRSMQLHLEYGKVYDLGAYVTAVDPAAPLLFQWDNPVSAYRYDGGSTAHRWGLTHGFQTVEAVSLEPWMWEGASKQPLTHQGEGAILILKGAYDRNIRELALFPSTIRSDLHGVRSVIEAHSKANKIQTPVGQLASGLMIGSKGTGGAVIRVTTDTVIQDYLVDRWD